MPRLLVVDDDQGTRETSAVILQDAGYAVDLAHSGTAAIIALSNGGRVDGLLLDLRLGDMTGYDVKDSAGFIRLFGLQTRGRKRLAPIAVPDQEVASK